jgi:hypothetical protein
MEGEPLTPTISTSAEKTLSGTGFVISRQGKYTHTPFFDSIRHFPAVGKRIRRKTRAFF